MHADERNRAMSEALGEDVYHYHLHVVYIPVVEKEIRWTKRCKDKSLVGKVKETIMQVSMSKKDVYKRQGRYCRRNEPGSHSGACREDRCAQCGRCGCRQWADS